MTLLSLLLIGCIAPNDNDTGNGIDFPDVVDEPEQITVVTFNAESGDAQDWKVAQSIEKVKGEAIWGIQEVEDEGWAETFRVAAADDGQTFEYVIGTTGWDDKIVILWDPAVVTMMDYQELDGINVGGTARAPLVAIFRSVKTGKEFKFMTNHLWRTEWQNRHEQAVLLNGWAREQTLPAISVGDFNFDWEVEAGDANHDAGYDLMTEDGVWKWVRPPELIRTQCSSFYDSVLDFVFVSGAARDWEGTSEILEPEFSYCARDDWEQSDHRPVAATITIP